jgi:hypothetical protein
VGNHVGRSPAADYEQRRRISKGAVELAARFELQQGGGASGFCEAAAQQEVQLGHGARGARQPWGGGGHAQQRLLLPGPDGLWRAGQGRVGAGWSGHGLGPIW